MAPPTGPDGFMSLIVRCATLGIVPIALIFHRLTSKTGRPQPAASWPSFLAVALAGLAWQATVSLLVPDPYLDEIFHIPQAQKYCDGHWSEWNDKITTPPGLYFFSVAAHRLWWLLLGGCSPLTLRMTNWLTIITVPVVASQCRRLLETRSGEQASESGSQRSSQQQQQQQQQHDALSSYALHTGVNVAFFPLLFFFSGLYYTDVLSTLVVLVAFWNTLVRMNTQATSWRSDALVVLLAVAALLMRQTNVFWVVVFLGGLEAVHAAGALRPPPTRPGAFDRPTKIKFYLSRYAQGEIHDPPLDATSLDDVLYCALSIAMAVICNPLRVLRQIWAHILTMVLFASFVFWNGGVVLGDKSNHVATIHLPQMLYIWPLFAFFSAPLLLPTVVHPVLTLLGPAPPSSLSKPAPTTSTSTFSKVLNIAGYTALFPAALAIVKFNTIIHPFTLADNRHYMFYVFRYSILRAPWVRYALVPIYVISGVLCLKALCGTASSSSSGRSSIKGPVQKASTRNGKDDPRQTRNQNNQHSSASYITTLPPTLSTTLLLVLTTTLSLMTAPLVEPRYFILPWVFWRLLLPAWSPPPSFLKAKTDSRGGSSKGTNPTHRGEAERRDSNNDNDDGDGDLWWVGLLPLWLETAWFGIINLATMYIFITRPFRWASEEGVWQRFMW